MRPSHCRLAFYRQRGLSLIETVTSFALICVCVSVFLGVFVQITHNQAFMLKQDRALNIAQRAVVEAWNTGCCYEAKDIAQSEGMILTCTKVSYGARIELEWPCIYGKIQHLQIN